MPNPVKPTRERERLTRLNNDLINLRFEIEHIRQTLDSWIYEVQKALRWENMRRR